MITIIVISTKQSHWSILSKGNIHTSISQNQLELMINIFFFVVFHDKVSRLYKIYEKTSSYNKYYY